MANYNNNSYFPQSYMNTQYGYGAGMTPAQTWTTPTPAQPQNQTSSINWVQGEAGARSFNVPSGQTALLMDSETNVFYIKTSDISGIPLPLRKFKYEEVPQDAQSDDRALSTYITKDELDARLKEFAEQLKEDKPNGKFDI